MKNPYLSTVSGVLLTALPLLVLLNGCGGGGSGPKIKPTATPVATATATPTATIPPVQLQLTNTVYNLTVSADAGSNYDDTFTIVSNGIHTALIAPQQIIISSNRGWGRPDSNNFVNEFKLELSSESPIQVGDIFSANTPTRLAKVSSSKKIRKQIKVVDFRMWNNSRDSSGTITVTALSGNSATLECSNVVLFPSGEDNAVGTITFTGTIQTTLFNS